MALGHLPHHGKGRVSSSFLLTATHLHPMSMRMHRTLCNGLARGAVPAVWDPWVPEHRGAHSVAGEELSPR